MPSKSKAQQRFFGVVKGIQKGTGKGTGKAKPVLEFLPENHTAKSGNKVYTSGKEGIFSPGIPIGEIISTDNKKILVSLFSDLTQVTFVNINIED